jgi:hypothetical protein
MVLAKSSPSSVSKIPSTKRHFAVVKPAAGSHQRTKTTTTHHQGKTSATSHHEEELMSGPTAIANVLADLCPHGMLPIGTYRLYD